MFSLIKAQTQIEMKHKTLLTFKGLSARHSHHRIVFKSVYFTIESSRSPFGTKLWHDNVIVLLFSLDMLMQLLELQLFRLLLLLPTYLFMQEHSVNEWKTCIRWCSSSRKMGWLQTTYTTTQYNNWDKIKCFCAMPTYESIWTMLKNVQAIAYYHR